MAVDLTRALEMLDKIAPNRPRRSPVADLDATVDRALAPTMAAAPPASPSPEAAIDRALSTPSGGTYADFMAGRRPINLDDVLWGDGADGGPGPGGGASPGGFGAAPSAPGASSSGSGVSPTLGDIGLTGVTGHGIGQGLTTGLNIAGAIAGLLSGVPGLSLAGGRAGTIANAITQALTSPLSQSPQYSGPRASSPSPRGGSDTDDSDPDADTDTGPPNGIDANDGVTASDGGQSSGDSGEGDAGDSGTWHTGGTVKRTGRANVQRGEEVVRASEASRPGVRPLLKSINKPGASPLERKVADFERRHGAKRI